MKRPVGWYLLPKSGVPFHGPIPDGAVTLTEKPVDGVDSGSEVGTHVLVDEQAAEAQQVLDGPSSGPAVHDAVDGDDQVGGQEAKATS